MNALCRIGDFYYLTANTDAAWNPAPYIVRTNDLHHIDVAQRETVTNAVPYYFSKVDGKYYLTADEDFTTYDENAIIELDSQEDGTRQVMSIFSVAMCRHPTKSIDPNNHNLASTLDF